MQPGLSLSYFFRSICRRFPGNLFLVLFCFFAPFKVIRIQKSKKFIFLKSGIQAPLTTEGIQNPQLCAGESKTVWGYLAWGEFLFLQ